MNRFPKRISLDVGHPVLGVGYSIRLLSCAFCLSPLAFLQAAPVVRCHSIIVNPSTGPMAGIDISSDAAWSGTLTVTPPDGWTIDPQTHDIALQAGESKSLLYRIIKARETSANTYPFAIALSGGATETQTVRAVSAPHKKAKIDGKLDEWNDAIPLRFGDAGSQTTLRTYWDNAAFYLAVEVEERALVPSDKKTADGRFDAVQFFIGPKKGASEKRHEFLIEPTGKSKAVCKRLFAPGGADSKDGVLEKSAAVAVRNSSGVTVYEIAIPHGLLEGIRLDTGREVWFGLLVHDPDGSGLRDLCSIMNHPKADRNSPPPFWTQWKGGCWDGTLSNGGTEFGFCTSIH